MMKMKRVCATILTVCMVGSLLSGCGKSSGEDGGSNDKGSTNTTSEYTGSGPITDKTDAKVSVLATNSWYTTVDLANAEILAEVEKRAGVDVEWNLIDPTTYTDAVSPMLAAGNDLADIIYLPDLDPNQNYINSGMFVQLDQYFDSMPNFKKYLDENPAIKASLTAQDGHIYYVPVVGLPDNYLPCMMYNQKWLDKLGIAAPTTLDDFVAMLRQFKANDMNDNGDTTDEIPMSVMSAFLPQMFGWAFGLDLESGFYADENGTVHYAYYESENYKNYLSFLNGLYEEGLLEIEFTSLTRDQITERFANNITGVTFDYSWQMSQLYSTQFSDYDGNTGIVVGVDPLSGEYEGHLSGTNPVKGIFGVNKSASDVELAVRFLDFATSEECQELYVWGIEGESYTKDSDGTYSYTEKALSDSLWLQALGINPPCMPYHNSTAATNVLLPSWHVAIDEHLASFSHAPWPFIYATTEEAEEITFYLTDIQTYQDEMGVKFITGVESLSNFDKYLSTMKDMGIEKLITIKQQQYDRYSKAN